MLTRKYLEIIEGNGYMTFQKDATGVTHQSSTCIDHMIIRNNENCEFSVIQECFTDQYPLSLSYHQKSVAKNERVIYIFTVFSKLSINFLHCRNAGNVKWRNTLGLLRIFEISSASEIKPTKNGQETVIMNLYVSLKNCVKVCKAESG